MEQFVNCNLPRGMEAKLMEKKCLQKKLVDVKQQLKSVTIKLNSVTKFLNKTKIENIKENEKNGDELVTLPQIPSSSSSVPVQINSDNINQQFVNCTFPKGMETKLSEHKCLQEKQVELNKQLKSVNMELKFVAKFLKKQSRIEKLKENKINGQEISSSSTSTINSENIGRQKDFQISNQSQSPEQNQIDHNNSKHVNSAGVTNKNKKNQFNSNDAVVMSDPNSHYIKSSQQNKMHKNNLNSSKNIPKNTIQNTKDIVIAIQNNQTNVVNTLTSMKRFPTHSETSGVTSNSGSHVENNQPMNPARFLQTGNVAIFQDILDKCISIRNIIDPILQFHCNSTNNQPGAMNNQRPGEYVDCGTFTNFFVNNRGKGKFNKMINCQTNWRGNVYRPPMRGYISRGFRSRGKGRGGGRGYYNGFRRGIQHFRPYFNHQLHYNYNYHPETQFVHSHLIPVSHCLEDESKSSRNEMNDSMESEMISNNNENMNKTAVEDKNSRLVMANTANKCQINTAEQHSKENFKIPFDKSTYFDKILITNNKQPKGNEETTEKTQTVDQIPRNPDENKTSNESPKGNSHNKSQHGNGETNMTVQNKKRKKASRGSKSKITNEKSTSSDENLIKNRSQGKSNGEITETNLKTSRRSKKRKETNKNPKQNVTEINKKVKAKNKVVIKTKNKKAQCLPANNSLVQSGLNKPLARPVYIPSARGYRGYWPRPSLLPYYRPPFYWHHHNFANNDIFVFDDKVRTAGEVLPKSHKQTSTDVISTTNNNLSDPVVTNEEMNDKQHNVHTEEIQVNANSDTEKSSEVNNIKFPCTSDKNTVPDSTEHIIDLTMVNDTPNEDNRVNMPEKEVAINKTSKILMKNCAVTAVLQYDDDTSQSNTKMLLNNLNNIEPAIKSLYVSVKKYKEITTENVPVKEGNITIKEECAFDNYSSGDIGSIDQNITNFQCVNSDFIEEIKEIKLEKIEIPNDSENERNIIDIKPSRFHDPEQINDTIKAANNISKNKTNISPKQLIVNTSSPLTQNLTTVAEAKNQTNIMDNEYINTVIDTTSNINPKELKNNTKVDCFDNAEIIASIPTNLINVSDINKNENVDDYSIISMEIYSDDDDNDSDATELLENLCSVKDSESDTVAIQDIESDIVEIIDIIKTNPTDFETLLDIINNSSDGTDSDNVLLNDIATAIGDILKNSSSHSLKATMSKERVTGKMSKKERRKRHLKTQNSIQKLFHQLRETSQYDSPLGQHSPMNSQNSSQASVVNLEDSNITMIPNELRKNFQTNNNDNSILVLDEELKACSTPKRESLQKPINTIVVEDVVLAKSNRTLNETKMINRSSFQTIDLTTDSVFNRTKRSEPTVIEISDTCDDVTLVSGASSMSGDSEVTILRQPISRKLKKFTNGIANLNAEEKGKLLELITQTIFNGCDVKNTPKTGVPDLQKALPRAADTAEDTYIKEVILGTKPSRSSIGSNIYHPDRQKGTKIGPRMIVIDGSNVAMEHGRGHYFSVRGLQICINYFLRRGHVVKAFVPRFRCKAGKSSDPRLLDFLERKGLVIYTPSREVQGRTITPYDDRYIIQCAAEFDAVVVSGDNFRDLASENPRWSTVINTSVLPFTWVDDMIMFPRDPLGRHGPTLKQFLRHPDPGRAVKIN